MDKISKLVTNESGKADRKEQVENPKRGGRA